MTGQDAVTVAESFDATLALDGVILTKLDGDARGGAALSVKEVVGKPIAFASTARRSRTSTCSTPTAWPAASSAWATSSPSSTRPSRSTRRKRPRQAAAKLLEGKFTLDDFLEQLQQVSKMGPLQNLMGMMPGMPKEMRDAEIDDGQVNRVEAIIRSMTRDERVDPTIIDGSRRLRIANGSGTQTSDVSQLIKQFREMQKMMKRMPGLSGTKACKGQEGQEGRAQGRRRPGDARRRRAHHPQAALHAARAQLTTAGPLAWSPACGLPRHARAAHHRRSLRTRLRRSCPERAAG